MVKGKSATRNANVEPTIVSHLQIMHIETNQKNMKKGKTQKPIAKKTKEKGELHPKMHTQKKKRDMLTPWNSSCIVKSIQSYNNRINRHLQKAPNGRTTGCFCS